MLPKLKLNNDSLLHWCFGALVGWALLRLVLGIPVLAFGIRSASIALLLAVQCALQIAVMPWLFSARGQTLRRTKVVIVWLTLACEAAFLQMSGGNFSDKAAVAIFLGGPIVIGSISVIALHWFHRRQTQQS